MEELLGFALGLGAVAILLFGLIGIAIYIFQSLVLMNYVKEQDGEYAWMAWLPFVDMYTYAGATYKGQDSAVSDLFKEPLPVWLYQWQTLVYTFGPLILSIIPVLIPISGLAVLFARFVLFGQVYKDSMRRYGVEITTPEQILITIIPLVAYFRLFGAMRNGTTVI
ncbi:MAG: hypothetical protein K6F00_03480 [Lachnospiraceae bacterium]|nr:hypothetical protein [Lachnospiraceae bacterium]